jgi:Kef-type K+ transport system membrane component KefB/K+/H+ antiporter YhaU regulatory subunit KhtT
MAPELLAILALGALVLAAAGYLAQRLRMPPVFGYLVAGSGLGVWARGRDLFPVEPLEAVSGAGVLLILFLIGAELDLDRLRKTVRDAAFVLPFDILLPFVLAGGVGRVVFGWSFGEAIALGAAVATSSTLLADRLTAGADAVVRRRVIGISVSEDVAAAGLLGLLAIVGSGQASTSGGLSVVWSMAQLLFLVLLLTAAALLIVPRVLDEAARRHVHEVLVLSGLAVVAVWGYLGDRAGSAELGAFVAGVAAAEAGSQFTVRNALLGLRDAALAIFFFTSGFVTDVGPLLASWWLPLIVAAVFLGAKILVHVPGGIAAGFGSEDALRNAFALGTLGELSLILASVATREGIAHPTLQAIIMGAMLVLLPVCALLLAAAPRLAAALRRMPPGIRRPLEWLRTGLRGVAPGSHTDPSQRRAALRTLLANLVLLVALAGLAAWGAPNAAARIDAVDRTIVLATVWGIAIAASLPLWVGAFGGYRDLVWLLVGLRPGERVGAGRVRMLLIDAFVAATAVLVLAFVTLSAPATLPVLGAAAVVAAAIGILAWRRLTVFHRTLEDTMSRVLGRDEQAARMLDALLQRYPWGVRSAAVIVPPDSPVARRTVGDARIGHLTGAVVAVVQRGSRETVNPPPDAMVQPGDTLVLMGDPHQLARAEALIVSHGDAIRMTAQTRQAVVEEVELKPGARWIGKTLAEADVRGESGCLVAGLWPAGAAHPLPYQPGRVLEAGDRLVVLGTRLQLDRLRATQQAAPGDAESPVTASGDRAGAGSP